MSTEERLIGRLREASPGALALAEVVSFAVLVEPQLLRRARLELLNDVDVGAEADLWLSRIVQSRGPEGIVLLPRAAELLRLSLADKSARPEQSGQPDLLERAWRLTSEMHEHLPVTLRFEEEINRLSVNPDDLALSRIESLLQSIAGTLVEDEERRGLANWAARALPRLPEAIRRLEPARVLAMASYLRLGAALPVEESLSDAALPEWVAWALPKNLTPHRLGAQLVSGGVEFGPAPPEDENVIVLPATNPLLVEMSWTEGGQKRFKQVSLMQGERKRFDAPYAEITLRTVLGDRYTITPLPDAEGEEQESTVMQQNRPLCYVAMPFGHKTDPQTGRTIDFDAIYRELIRPAIEQAGFEPSRADEMVPSGPVEKSIFERLIFSEFVVVDLTTSNPNTLYELGLRHAVRPSRTVLIMADETSDKTRRVPSDLAFRGAITYTLDEERMPVWAEQFQRQLSSALTAEVSEPDSPVFQLIEGYTAPQIDASRADPSGEREQRSNELKRMIAAARHEGVEAVREAERQLGDIKHQDSGVVNDLLNAYRSVGAWEDMLALVAKMPAQLADTVPVRQQQAFALHRAGRGEEAEKILQDLLSKQGPSSETFALLGRIYKDRWRQGLSQKGGGSSTALLGRAIDAYLRGFETDWRDPTSGLNAATLMEFNNPSDPRREEILPVARYAAKRRIAAGHPTFWDYATLLDLAVLSNDEKGAKEALDNLHKSAPVTWEAITVVENLKMIREARERRRQNVGWLREIEERLGKMGLSGASSS